MEITDFKKLIQENNLDEKNIHKTFKQFNSYLNLVELTTKKSFRKELPEDLKNASPIFDEVIQKIFFAIRKTYNDVHNI